MAPFVTPEHAAAAAFLSELSAAVPSTAPVCERLIGEYG